MASRSWDRARWLRRTRNAAIVVVVLLLVAGVVGYFAAPGLVRSIAERQIAEQLGRRATIGAVRLDPFRLSATIDDFRLYEADGTSVAVEVGSLYADVSAASLYKRALVLDQLRVSKPVVRIARLDAQRFSFSDVVDRLAAQPKSDTPFRFSLNNIELDGGAVDFDDRVTDRRHRVEGLRIALPFLSNLPYDTAIFVTPAFAATVDGSPIALTGKVQPFSNSREAAVEVELSEVDVPRYVALAPTALPVRLLSGKLAAKLALHFRAATIDAGGRTVPQSMVLSGHVGLTAIDLADAAGRSAVRVDAIDADVSALDPLGGDIAIDRIAVRRAHVEATRRPDGSVDLVTLFRPPLQAAPPPAAKPPIDAAARGAAPPALRIASFRLDDGSVRFTDQALKTPATVQLTNIDATIDAIALSGTTPTTFRITAAADDGATVDLRGSVVAATRVAVGTAAVKGVPLSRVAPYLDSMLAARLDDGRVDASARFRVDAGAATPVGLVDAIAVRVDRLRTSLPGEKSTLLGADVIALEGGSFDLARRVFAADAVRLVAPVVAVRRDAKGRLNLSGALMDAKVVDAKVVEAPAADAKPAASADGGSGAAAAVVVAPAAAPPFTATVRSLTVERGDLTFEDLAAGAPVRVRVQPFDLHLQNVGTALDARVPFRLDATVDQRGRLAVEGTILVDPLTVDATIDAKQVALAWLAAYAGDRLNVRIESADLDTRGTLRIARPAPRKGDASPGALALAYHGSLGVTRMRLLDRATSEEFVRWKSLTVPQVDLQMPAKAAPFALALGPVALNDFYARLIVNANGRLNLQDVVASPGQQQSVTTPDAQPTAAGGAATGRTAPAAPPATRAAAPSIRVAGISVAGGRIGITDNLIRPNYSANLTGLSGQVSALASEDSKPADVKLTGRINGDGALDVQGRIDPFAATLFADIAAEAKDIELTRLTPYAVKYAGYAIDRGKLSMTVKYHIENGRLEAQNRLFLDQLTFGAKVESPTATELPVLLAVALLKNARGEIDINLPISGSLSDPEFSVGSVIARVLGNLIVRAVTSPFSLIASAVGGAGGGKAEELGYVEFRPGVSDMTDEGMKRVELLAKGLAAKPALRLDIIGRYDPVGDPDGLRRDHLLDQLKDLKANDLSKSGDRVGRNDVTILADEYPKYLERVYDDTKLADKPRNVIGLAKSVPVAEMERLLLAATKLDENDPRWLAEARADVVRHYLEDTGQVAASRVFLVTPKLTADGIPGSGTAARVDFALR